MMKIETVILEDKLEYAIVDTIVINNTKYIYLGLVSELEENNKKLPVIVIRKMDKKGKYIVGLDTEEEYKMALEAFVKKHQNENS